MAATKRVTILLTEAEYGELQTKCGIASMSAWIKERIFRRDGGPVVADSILHGINKSALNDKEVVGLADQGAIAGRSKNPSRFIQGSEEQGRGKEHRTGESRTAKVVAEKTCKHGTPRGYHCWQCGGTAQIGGSDG